MKILIHSQYSDSMGLAMHLQDEGHSVYYFVEEKNMRESGKGIINHLTSMAEGMKLKPDLVMFDFTKEGKMADNLRKVGVPVWGGSELADDLERDRKFGSDFAKRCGIKVPDFTEFKSIEEAKAHVLKKPDTYVIKMDGDCSSASSYVSKGPQDMVEYLDYLKEQNLTGNNTFVLQKKIDGVEISTEVLFSQGKPVPPFNHTFETKKFMPGDLGPNTGCETSVVIPVVGKSKMMEKTLQKTFGEMEKVKYTGHLDINCIVNERDHEPYFLEWTPRFGYSSLYATLAMMNGRLGEMYLSLARGSLSHLPIVHYWGTSLRMSIPPYPFEESPDVFKESENQWIKPSTDKKNTWWVNVKKDNKQRLVTSGFYGLVAECTGQGRTLSEAWKKSQKVFDEIHVANKQGRYIDGIESAQERIKKLKSWGFEMPGVN